MIDLATLTALLIARQDLSTEDAGAAATALASPEVSDEVKAAFLTALSAKGESVAELAAFARAFRARAVDPEVGAWSAQARQRSSTAWSASVPLVVRIMHGRPRART